MCWLAFHWTSCRWPLRVMGSLPIRTPLQSTWLFIPSSAPLISFSLTHCKCVSHWVPFFPSPSALLPSPDEPIFSGCVYACEVVCFSIVFYSVQLLEDKLCVLLHSGLPFTMTVYSIYYYYKKSYFSLRQYGYLWLTGGKIQVGKSKHKDEYFKMPHCKW